MDPLVHLESLDLQEKMDTVEREELKEYPVPWDPLDCLVNLDPRVTLEKMVSPDFLADLVIKDHLDPLDLLDHLVFLVSRE